jgi:hypothetical protein
MSVSSTPWLSADRMQFVTEVLVSASERLTGKARDYELLAASHAERVVPVGGGIDHRMVAVAFTVAAIVLREVAAAIEAERE